MITMTKTQSEKTTNISLTGNDIVKLIEKKGNAVLTAKIKSAKRIEVVFDVPTGGDYSGIELDINDKCPIMVRIVN